MLTKVQMAQSHSEISVADWKEAFIDGYVASVARYARGKYGIENLSGFSDEGIEVIRQNCFLFFAKVWRKSADCYKSIINEARQAGYDFAISCIYDCPEFCNTYWPLGVEDILSRIASEFPLIIIDVSANGLIFISNSDELN